MSVNSLPSFAQAFSHRSLQNIQHQSNALPPIHPIHMSTKKRHNDEVKEEGDDDDDAGAPPPSSTVPSPLKKRRVTVSGTNPHPLRIDVRPSSNTNGNGNPDHTINANTSTPISPVVMGFTIQRDNPNAIEQVRNMISVKQKQKALIEQRRGSAAGLVSPTVAATPVEDRPSGGKTSSTTATTAQGGRSSRRSPNTGMGTRRSNSNNNGGNTQGQQQRASSPQPTSSSSLQIQQQQSAPPPQQPSHSLPPPPISFARRRAAQTGSKKKPADILISPRESLSQSHPHLSHARHAGHHDDRFQPSIQSAPPTQNAFFLPGRLPMALPRLPQIGGDATVRRTAANVPPTPTRLSMMQNVAATQTNSNSGATTTGVSQTPPTSTRSPPASVPISASLQSAIPPTPTVLRNPTYTATPEAKAAFLGPFEVFYDALNDAKQLKTWLGEQLQKSNALVAGMEKEREKMKEWVEGEVERRVATVREEIMGEMASEVGLLRKRVEELEGVLRGGSSGLAEAYTFPPMSGQLQEASRLRPERPELARRCSSPGWGHSQHDRETQRDRPRSERGSPGPPSVFDARRMSTSAIRLEGPSTSQSSNSAEPSRGMHSPPLVWESQRDKERPTLSRQNSSHHERERERGMPMSIPMVVVGDWEGERGQVSRERERGGESHRDRESHREERETSAPLTRRPADRRDSVVMASLEDES